MTPSDLTALLEAARDVGALSVEIPTEHGPLRATFAVPMMEIEAPSDDAAEEPPAPRKGARPRFDPRKLQEGDL